MPGPAQWVTTRGVGHRRGSDLVLLWLQHRRAAAAPIRPLAWELSFATGEALKGPKKKEKRKEKKKEKKKKYVEEFPLWLSGLGAQRSVHEDAGPIPALAQWVKDLTMP